MNVPFFHPTGVKAQKDGRKVRSRDEGTFTSPTQTDNRSALRLARARSAGVPGCSAPRGPGAAPGSLAEGGPGRRPEAWGAAAPRKVIIPRTFNCPGAGPCRTPSSAGPCRTPSSTGRSTRRRPSRRERHRRTRETVTPPTSSDNVNLDMGHAGQSAPRPVGITHLDSARQRGERSPTPDALLTVSPASATAP